MQGIYFDEGAGFVLVSSLGQGSYGKTSIVRSVKDNKLYVRKEELTTHEHNKSTGRNREVAHAMLAQHHPGVARVVGWANYEKYTKGPVFVVSYWQYYNAGTLVGLYETAVQYRIFVPERWVCLWLISMMSAVIDIHKAGLAHGDAKDQHWFLHRPGPGRHPVVVLGDFGTSYLQDEEDVPFEFPRSGGHEDGTWTDTVRGDYKQVLCEAETMLHLCDASPQMDSIVQRLRNEIYETKNEDLEENMSSVYEALKWHLADTPTPTAQQMDQLAQDSTPKPPFLPYTEEVDMANLKTWMVASHLHDDKITLRLPPQCRRFVDQRVIADGDWDPSLMSDQQPSLSRDHVRSVKNFEYKWW